VPVLPGAEGFSHSGAAVGVLLCHGFTGTPQGLRPWASQLVAAGYSVELPLLPGHGTAWQDLNGKSWQDWYGAVDDALATLRGRCSTVFVAGLSMGGCLALRLAEEHGDALAGVILVNPFVKLRHPLVPLMPVLSRVISSFPGVVSDIKKEGPVEIGYDRLPLRALSSLLTLQAEVVSRLSTVRQPLLLLHSAEDHVVKPSWSNSELVFGAVSSTDKTEIVLEDSYHVATLDNDADRIFKESLAFIGRLAGGDQP
jgi:carboxylesterase